jgi:RNA methyltransferase, TrmH family
MKKITSPDNALVKKALKHKDPRNRDQLTRCLVEGMRAVETFLNSPYTLNRIYITEKNISWAQEHCPEESIVLVSDQIMQKLSSTTSPSGILGMFDMPSYSKPARMSEIRDGIVLVNLQDPGNVGTLIRTATALKKSIVLIDGVNPYNPKVIQATAGTLAQADLFRISWQELMQHKGDLRLSALVVDKGIEIQKITDPKKPRLLIVGSEAHGLPEEWLEQCDEKITLPMPGGTESLNAAVAGSIALYILSLQNS